MDKDNEKLKDDKSVCRAMITPSEEGNDFDFECIAVPSENGQMRYSYREDEYFMQVLRTGKENIDDSRMESGLPLFDNHPWDNSAKNTLGITVGYDFTDAGIVMRCKFGSRADEALRADVKNGIIKTVSIEGDITEYTVERKEGQVPTYYATMWQPTSLSFAPVPNDISAQIEVKRALARQIEKSNTQPSFLNSLIKNIKK